MKFRKYVAIFIALLYFFATLLWGGIEAALYVLIVMSFPLMFILFGSQITEQRGQKELKINARLNNNEQVKKIFETLGWIFLIIPFLMLIIAII